jgi:hypothetical protein
MPHDPPQPSSPHSLPSQEQTPAHGAEAGDPLVLNDGTAGCPTGWFEQPAKPAHINPMADEDKRSTWRIGMGGPQQRDARGVP